MPKRSRTATRRLRFWSAIDGRELATQMVSKFQPVAGKQVQGDFAVAVSSELVGLGTKVVADGAVAVELAIHDHSGFYGFPHASAAGRSPGR